jgi:hypothetical protein
MARLVNGQYVDCTPEFQVTATGAQTVNTRHVLSLLGNINAAGAVSISTPEGKTPGQ